MAEISVVLVEPKHQCNVGFVARAMKNFGLSDLFFAGKKYIPDKKAFECAAHAKDVLKKSNHLEIGHIPESFDVLVGTTAKAHLKENSPRNAIEPEKLSEKLSEIHGKVALLLGRDDIGLSNNELDVCDIVVSIPASSEYSTLNLSHAAAILFYELSKLKGDHRTDIRDASGDEKEALIFRLRSLLDSVGYPNYKKKVTERIFRKVIGRAGVSAREAHTLAGVFKEAADEIKRSKKRV
jgi:TrmH family RNA methyltransferase